MSEYRILFIALFIIWPLFSVSQGISNIQASQFNKEIIITYDLINALPSDQFLVKAVCIKGDLQIPVTHAKGNGIGSSVKGGTGRQIVWSVTSDVETLEGDDIYFKIIGTKLAYTEAPVQARGGELSVADRKYLVKTELSSDVDNYLEQVYNLITTFQNFGSRAFESRADFERLRLQVEKTNETYDKLLPRKESYKQSVRSLWGSEAINCEVDTFLGKILDDLHRTFILPLNGAIKDINGITTDTNMKKSEREAKIERIKIELEIRTSQLVQLVNSSKGDAKAIYTLIER